MGQIAVMVITQSETPSTGVASVVVFAVSLLGHEGRSGEKQHDAGHPPDHAHVCARTCENRTR